MPSSCAVTDRRSRSGWARGHCGCCSWHRSRPSCSSPSARAAARSPSRPAASWKRSSDAGIPRPSSSSGRCACRDSSRPSSLAPPWRCPEPSSRRWPAIPSWRPTSSASTAGQPSPPSPSSSSARRAACSSRPRSPARCWRRWRSTGSPGGRHRPLRASSSWASAWQRSRRRASAILLTRVVLLEVMPPPTPGWWAACMPRAGRTWRSWRPRSLVLLPAAPAPGARPPGPAARGRCRRRPRGGHRADATRPRGRGRGPGRRRRGRRRAHRLRGLHRAAPRPAARPCLRQRRPAGLGGRRRLLLVVSADLIARRVADPVELPVGIVTVLMGAPFFLWLLLRADRVRAPPRERPAAAPLAADARLSAHDLAPGL